MSDSNALKINSHKPKSVALIGSPNSGKTTLYNWLTGASFKTVNYPGATVEYSLGTLAHHLHAWFDGDTQVLDTPGTYSLHPKSADEVVTLKSIYENPKVGRAESVIVVVDATQLDRHLILAQQIMETGFPMMLVITMADILRKNKIEINTDVLAKHFNCPVVLFDGVMGGGLKEIVTTLKSIDTSKCPEKPYVWDEAEQEKKLKVIEGLAQKALLENQSSKEKIKQVTAMTEKLDRFLLHPFFGLILFFGIMFLLFSSIFWFAAPFMDWIDGGTTWLVDTVTAWGPGTLWADFLANGLVAAFGGVLIFVPQIFILFLLIGAFESSGYLSRAATLIDRPFSKTGLSGRSFVPILSGFACALPALMATRNIPSRRDRWITNFIIPLMTCSARLPVYALLLTFLFKDQSAWKPGLALAVLYIAAILVGALAAGLLHRFLPKGETSMFMMELPMYRMPRFRVLFKQSLTRTKAFIFRAGPVIFVLAVLIWAGTNFPNYQEEDEAVKVETSYLGQVGHAIEPIFEPMGVDWRVGLGLITSFAAREVFVSTLALTFHAEGDDEDAQAQSLLDTMANATNRNGEKIFTVASVVGLLVFFMIALQCMSTVGLAVKETGSVKFAMIQLVVFNVVAYVLAVGLYQLLK